jgi:hypothetical protein
MKYDLTDDQLAAIFKKRDLGEGEGGISRAKLNLRVLARAVAAMGRKVAPQRPHGGDRPHKEWLRERDRGRGLR